MATHTNILVWQKTAAVAIAQTFAPAQNFVLLHVKLHLSAAGGAVEDYTITLDANAGAAYDILLRTVAMNAVADDFYQPTLPIFFEKGDEIDFAYTNTNTRTYGLEVAYRLEL
jgi:hypothetical protein